MEKHLLLTLSCFIWITFFVIRHVGADGIVSIQFKKYTNPGGLGSNGHCCDGRWKMCNSLCDHKFTVCLDTKTGGSDIDHCDYGQIVTQKVKNSNTNIFGSKFAGVANPVLFQIKGSINIMALLKVKVVDVDNGVFSSSNDHVDDLQADIYVHKGPFASINMPVTLNSRTKLETVVEIRCAPDWYNEDCSVFCRPSKEDNYYCDGWTGEKICHPNWMGENCDTVEQNL